jgi:hypothetical protein
MVMRITNQSVPHADETASAWVTACGIQQRGGKQIGWHSNSFCDPALADGSRYHLHSYEDVTTMTDQKLSGGQREPHVASIAEFPNGGLH